MSEDRQDLYNLLVAKKRWKERTHKAEAACATAESALAALREENERLKEMAELQAKRFLEAHENVEARIDAGETALATLRAGVEKLADAFASLGNSGLRGSAAWSSAANHLTALLGGGRKE